MNNVNVLDTAYGAKVQPRDRRTEVDPGNTAFLAPFGYRTYPENDFLCLQYQIDKKLL